MLEAISQSQDAILALEVTAQVGAARCLRRGSDLSRRLNRLAAYVLVTAQVHAVGPMASFLTQPLVI